jgi:hypothetical protein
MLASETIRLRDRHRPAATGGGRRGRRSALTPTPGFLPLAAVGLGVGGWATGWGQWSSALAGLLGLLGATFAADEIARAGRRPNRGRLVGAADATRRALVGLGGGAHR